MPVELKKQQVIDLTKKAQFQLSAKGLDTTKARVHLILDISGSMRNLYLSGTVQNVVSRLLALAIPLDDDGQLDVRLFGSEHYQMPNVTIEEVEGYVAREILTKHRISEGTYYAKALAPLVAENKPSSGLGKLFKGNSKQTTPALVIFITDGDNADKGQTETLMRELSALPVFVQFVGIGSESFQFLSKLDDLTGRVVDNAGFMKVSDIDAIKDSELYGLLLTEFSQWIDKAKSQKILPS